MSSVYPWLFMIVDTLLARLWYFCGDAAGSEVQICVDVAKALAASGTRARVVSMPCWELFEDQDEAYQLSGELFESVGRRKRRCAR